MRKNSAVLFCVLVHLACLCAGQQARGQSLEYPLAVVAASDGTVYVADRNLPGIWKVEEGKPELYFQASKKFRTPLNAVRCLALDNEGRLLAGDSATREVYRFDDQGNPQPLAQGMIGIPMALAVNGAGDIFVVDLETHVIYTLPATGGKPVEFASVPAPRGVAIDKEDNVWVVSHGPDSIIRIAPDKSRETMVAGKAFQFAHQIDLDDSGNAYVTDGYGQCVWKIPAGGEPEKLYSGEPLKNPVGIDIRGEELLIADPHVKTVFTAPLAGGMLRSLLQGPQ